MNMKNMALGLLYQESTELPEHVAIKIINNISTFDFVNFRLFLESFVYTVIPKIRE